MKKLMKNTLTTAVAASVATLLAAGSVQAVEYEVWAPDQSNSVAGAGAGSSGGYINIWEGTDVETFFRLDSGTGTGPAVIGCDRTIADSAASAVTPGPCDVHAVFPDALVNSDTGLTLGAMGGKSRVHGMIPDPQSLYFNVNFFSGGAGYVGLMDGRSKEAVALFRVTETLATGAGKSVHMSFWNADGSALLVANLHGKAVERIDIDRDVNGNIETATFNRSATLAFADVNANVITTASFFSGLNGTGVNSMGAAGLASGTINSAISGSYDTSDGGPLDGRYVSNGDTYCMEDGCSANGGDVGTLITSVGRAVSGNSSNVVVCPIVTSNNKMMVTFGGGGLVVADIDTTPMTVVGGYSSTAINGAGCGGSEIGGNVYLNAGANAGGGGALKSTFGVYKLNISAFESGVTGSYAQTPHTEGLPQPKPIAVDGENTQGFGNTTGLGGLLEFASGGTVTSKFTGQHPDTSTRRDSHGMTSTTTGNFIHIADRIQNTVTAVSTANDGFSVYSIRGATGLGCDATDLANGVTGNDPAGDLMATGPNNDVLFIALRGPVPVTVGHAAQGSCPGVGIITLDKQKDPATGTPDEAGTMNHVMRTVNTVDTVAPITYVETATGNGILAGDNYTGTERSDIHGVAIRVKGPGG